MFRIYYKKLSEISDRDAWIRECALAFCAEHQIDPGDTAFSIQKTALGKPFFADTEKLYLSISDSQDYLALALSTEEIGVDLQIMRFRLEFTKERALKMAKRFFHPAEQEYICCVEEEILPRFFEIWTKKESFVKRTGTGIDDSFSSLNVLDYSFYMESPFPDYVLAVSTP